MNIKYYISGPMSEPEHKATFARVEAELIEMGYKVVNPYKLPRAVWPVSIRQRLRAMLSCNHVFQVPGWEECPLAMFENYVASHSGMTVSRREE